MWGSHSKSLLHCRLHSHLPWRTSRSFTLGGKVVQNPQNRFSMFQKPYNNQLWICVHCRPYGKNEDLNCWALSNRQTWLIACDPQTGSEQWEWWAGDWQGKEAQIWPSLWQDARDHQGGLWGWLPLDLLWVVATHCKPPPMGLCCKPFCCLWVSLQVIIWEKIRSTRFQETEGAQGLNIHIIGVEWWATYTIITPYWSAKSASVF